MKKGTTKGFIEKAKNKFPHLEYNYSKVEYVKCDKEVTIICPKHGEFKRTPERFFSGRFCPLCGREESVKKRTFTTKDFINKANDTHGGYYNYYKTDYKNNHTEVTITCPIHGDFKQLPIVHLRGNGCKKCGQNSIRKGRKVFIEEAIKIHSCKYDYSKVDYINTGKEVTITCPVHGDFKQLPVVHLKGCGCQLCAKDAYREKRTMSTNEFISKARQIHGKKYSYEKVDYKNNHTDITITCPIHGDFKQQPNNHLYGKGCPYCKASHLEAEIRGFLCDKGIKYIEQANNRHFQWLGLQSLDFYLPEFNVAIECQGEQHFRSIEYFGGHNTLEVVQKRDKLKAKKCQENKVNLLYYSNLGITYPYRVYENKEELLNKIKEYGRKMGNDKALHD